MEIVLKEKVSVRTCAFPVDPCAIVTSMADALVVSSVCPAEAVGVLITTTGGIVLSAADPAAPQPVLSQERTRMQICKCTQNSR